jgi:hypothetical protein
MCPVCGYARPTAPCAVCAGEGVMLGKRNELVVGARNPVLDGLRGIDDVRRAVFALLFEREFVGVLRGPIAANVLATAVLVVVGWTWLLPAFEQHFRSQGETGAHLWLFAIWLGAGPSLLDLLAGWAQDPIRRATEQHMLGATPTHPARVRPSLIDSVQMLMLAVVAVLLMLGLVLIPWVGLPLCFLLGAVVAAIVFAQTPLAVRGMTLKQRMQALRRQPWRVLGVGFGMQLAAAVPFLNVIALLPVATIAATSTYLHTQKGTTRAGGAAPTAAGEADVRAGS